MSINPTGHPTFAPMSEEELTAWLADHGMEPGSPELREAARYYSGRTEDEMNAEHESQHGSMA